MKRIGLVAGAVALAACAATSQNPQAGRSLFDGETLQGWERKAVHGGRGGLWSVENGVVVANQEPDHTGGLLGTLETFSDVEVQLEFMADDPADTGLFLRTQEDGTGYQVTIDVRPDGYVGSLYASGAGGFVSQYEDWREIFQPDDWNRLRVRIVGQPAHITTWLNGVQTFDFVDSEERFPREGYIGLQVHGGEGSWGTDSRARFRNVTVTEIQE